MSFRVRLRGRGEVEVAAYGIADAEHQVEKEIRTLLPDADISVLEIRRSEGPARIAELFRVRYGLVAYLTIDAKSPAAARTAALRQLRSAVARTPYSGVALEPAAPEPAG